MKIEQQVTSLEISKKLEALSVKQESLFYWKEIIDDYDHEEPKILQTVKSQSVPENRSGSYSEKEGSWEEKFYSAFTVSELGEMLPYQIDGYWLWNGKQVPIQGGWSVCYAKDATFVKQLHYETADTEADARGKMLIYLLENNLLTNPTIQ